MKVVGRTIIVGAMICAMIGLVSSSIERGFAAQQKEAG
jgi:hypothetical protein